MASQGAECSVLREGGQASPFYDSSNREHLMTLADRLAADMRKALLAGDSLRVSTIRLARASIQNAAIERGRDLTDEEIIEILGREMKRRREAIEAFAKGGRDDLVRKETLELAILTEYVPARSEEHTSELQSHSDLVCRLLLEKKNILIVDQGLRLGRIERRVPDLV